MLSLQDKVKEGVAVDVERKKERFERLEKEFNLLNPENLLKRGFSITTINGIVLTDCSQVKKGDLIETQLYNGQIISEVKETI